MQQVTLFTSWTGETFSGHPFDYNVSVSTLRYYAGWADKIYGKTIEVNYHEISMSKRADRSFRRTNSN